jgi:hypothetical protein
VEKENLQIYHAFCYCQSIFFFFFYFQFFDFKDLAKFSKKKEKLVEFTLEKKFQFFFFFSKYVEICTKNTVANQFNNELLKSRNERLRFLFKTEDKIIREIYAVIRPVIYFFQFSDVGSLASIPISFPRGN